MGVSIKDIMHQDGRNGICVMKEVHGLELPRFD